MYCVMRASALSLHNVYGCYDYLKICTLHLLCRSGSNSSRDRLNMLQVFNLLLLLAMAHVRPVLTQPANSVQSGLSFSIL